MRKLLSRAECSFGYKHYALPEGAFSCLEIDPRLQRYSWRARSGLFMQHYRMPSDSILQKVWHTHVRSGKYALLIEPRATLQ
jgi:hypothetical protein